MAETHTHGPRLALCVSFIATRSVTRTYTPLADKLYSVALLSCRTVIASDEAAGGRVARDSAPAQERQRGAQIRRGARSCQGARLRLQPEPRLLREFERDRVATK